MKTTYQVESDSAEFTLVKAKTNGAIYGRRVELDLSSYMVNSLVAITLEIKPNDQASSDMGAAMNGLIRIPDGVGGNHRVVEQSIDVKPIGTTVLSLSDIANGDVEAGRFVSAMLLRRVESVVEHLRRAVRQSLSKTFFDRAIFAIEDRYGDDTEAFIREYLGQLNWGMLLMHSECGDQCLSVINYTLSHNPPIQQRVIDDQELQVEPLGILSIGFSKADIADAKATVLLYRVCGKALAEEFNKDGKITLCRRGYTFVMRPGQFVKVFDRNGKSVRLCIHTFSFKCNPIDELTIAYLNIKHRFDEYWRTAIQHGCDAGFEQPKLGKPGDSPAAA